MPNNFLITAYGRQSLQKQLSDLQEELTRTVDERSKAAAEGDLKENSAYIFLTERATVLSTQISKITDQLQNVKVVPPPKQTDTIAFGHQVAIRFETDNRQMSLTLVGENDSSLRPGWVSCNSPIGQALLGKKVSDQVEVNGQTVTVLDIKVGDI